VESRLQDDIQKVLEIHYSEYLGTLAKQALSDFTKDIDDYGPLSSSELTAVLMDLKESHSGIWTNAALQAFPFDNLGHSFFTRKHLLEHDMQMCAEQLRLDRAEKIIKSRLVREIPPHIPAVNSSRIGYRLKEY
jgi:hypothetical protein